MSAAIHTVSGALVLGVLIASPQPVLSQAARPAAGRSADPCSLFTRAELQQLTGHADVMRVGNMPDQLSNGAKVCTIDGGGVGSKALDLEVIVYARTPQARVTTPNGAEAVPGIGDGAYFERSPGNAAAFAASGPVGLRIGVQSEDAPQTLRSVALALLRAGIAKLK